MSTVDLRYTADDLTQWLDTLELKDGATRPNDDGAWCAMEAAAWLANEEWSDHPECVSPVIASFFRAWNDQLPDEDRTRLIAPLIPKVIGTRTTPEDEIERAWILTDWLVRVQAPAWIRLAGLTEQADILIGLGEVSPDSCPSILPPLRAVKSDAAAAWDAAGAAARDAAWDAARDAAWDAARDAARDAAWDAARAAAWAAAWAAWAAAWDAAGAAARDAARAAAGAAWAAAWDAAGAAAWAAWAAAWDAAGAAARDAARAALKPTTTELQATVPDLMDRLINVGANA